MERLTITPRADWATRVEKLGFTFHSTDTIYWDESACYRFTAAQIDALEEATNELHRLCLEAVQRVIDGDLFNRFDIPEQYIPLIKSSWLRGDASLFGRFDLFYDGKNEPKMYEYNADTPTSLFEASVVQWHWLRDTFPQEDQFNSIHEKLIARWQESALKGSVHFTCVRDHDEDFVNTVYMEDTAIQAGLKTKRLFIDEIGWNGRQFVDLAGAPIKNLFKLYPWEWLISEEFSSYLLEEPWQVIEPAWKMLLSNKAILPLLWEMFPGHRNLLPTFLNPAHLGDNHIKKPMLGREGANVTLSACGHQVTTPGQPYAGGYIYQQFQPPPAFGSHYPVIGSWVVRDEAAGIGIRESSTLITNNTSRFVPHYFTA